MRTTILATATAFVCLLAAGQAWAAAQERRGQERPARDQMRGQGTARAALEAKSGSGVSGEVTLEERDGAVLVRVFARGLSEGLHGAHIHELGDCSAPDAKSAGGHFNPLKKAHAAPAGKERHAGDLGNVLADAQGNVKHESYHTGFTLGRGRVSVLGRAIVLHAGPDDLRSQPSGNSGAPIACGVIQPAQPRRPGEEIRN